MDHDGSGNNNFLKKQTNKAWCTCQAGVLVIYTLTRENDLIYTIVFCYCCRWCRGQLSTKLKKKCKLEPLTFTCFFSFSFWRVHWFCLGDSQLAQVNNSLRANEFPAGEARKVTPGHPGDNPGDPGWIWSVQFPVLIYLAACWFGTTTFGLLDSFR